jgi:integrase
LEVVRPAPVTRARPYGGPISEGTIDALLTAGWRFARAVSAVSIEVGEEPSPWHRLPAPVTAAALGALPANTDRSAPPVAAVRDALERLSHAIEDEPTASHLRVRLVRNRLLLALLACTGARVSAISRLRVSDYEPNRQRARDNAGPALRLRPGKTVPDHVVRWKPLPAEVGEWIEFHLESSGLSHELPLFPTARDRTRAMRPDLLTKLLLHGEGMTLARSAHTLRHLAERLAYQVGREHVAENGAELVPPQAYADALLDHAFATDPLGYKDLDQQREELAGIAAASIWRRLRGLDPPPAVTVAALRDQRKRLFERDISGSGADAIGVLLEHARLTTLIDDLSA